MSIYENGISKYIILLKIHCSAWRGLASDATIKAIATAINSFVQRLMDVYGTSDHTTLTSMYPINKITHGFSLMTLVHLNRLFASISRAKTKSTLKNALSKGLPSSMDSPLTPNQRANDLVAISSNQMVGIHKAKDTSGDCL
jgi:hypothetical protein